MPYKDLLCVPRGIRAIISTHVKAFGYFSRLVVFNPCKTGSLFHKTMSYHPQFLWDMEGGFGLFFFSLSTVYVATQSKILQGTQFTSLEGKGHLFSASPDPSFIRVSHLFLLLLSPLDFAVFSRRNSLREGGRCLKRGALAPSCGTN